MTTATVQTLDILQIKALLPHRYPFLLVDRVTFVEPGLKAVGYKNLTANEQFFEGHFPFRPIMPGVLMIEGMAQTAGALCMHVLGWQERKTLVYFVSIDEARFRKPVVPGDQVRYHMTRIAKRRNMWWFRGEAKVEGALVCEGHVSAMLVDQ